MTIREFLKEIEDALLKAGIDCAKREAELIACHILSADRVYLYTHMDEYIDEKILLASAAVIKERLEGRPLAYIFGNADFYGLDITVDERVLIPRPETELLVEEILNSSYAKGGSVKILDLCTGSGCIAAALAHNLPFADITASDLSLKALQIANYNLRKYSNVKTLRSDLFERIEEAYDIIVSNPPYIALSEREGLQKEVRDYEPEMALFSGEDGLDAVRVILKDAADHLNTGGLLLMEIGESQGEKVLEIIAKTGEFSSFEIKKDLSGLDRYLLARKK